MIPRNVESPEAMMFIGAEFAAAARPGNVFALVGELGAGKTHWTKGFVEKIAPLAGVTSPTFPIVNEYRGGRCTVFHFDFHRLKSEGELLALGWDEYLDEEAIVICEWADRFPALLPEKTVWLEIRHQADGTRQLCSIEKPPLDAGDAV